MFVSLDDYLQFNHDLIVHWPELFVFNTSLGQANLLNYIIYACLKVEQWLSVSYFSIMKQANNVQYSP